MIKLREVPYVEANFFLCKCQKYSCTFRSWQTDYRVAQISGDYHMIPGHPVEIIGYKSIGKR